MPVDPGFFSVTGFIYPWIGIPSAAVVAEETTYGPLNATTGTAELPIATVSVDHDYGGSEVLSYKTDDDIGITDATVLAYTTEDYDADNRNVSFVVGRTTTTTNGAWSDPILLVPGNYTLLYFRAHQYGPDTREITVA